MSTQVKFDESVFPLEGSNQTIDSHELATSTLKGVPRYPATGATMSVPSKAIPYPADVSVSGSDEPASEPAGFQESFDFSPVSFTSSSISNHSIFQDIPSSPPPTESFSSLLQDDNMEVDSTESVVWQSEQLQEHTAQMEKLASLFEELKENSSNLRSSPEATSSEHFDSSAPDLSTLSGVNFVKRHQVQTDQVPQLLGDSTRGPGRYVMVREDLFP